MNSKPPPLILHVIHHLVTGGLENGLVNLINNLPADRFRHAVVCIEDYSDFRHRIVRPDVKVIALNRSRIGLWNLRREIYRLCRELRPALVHSRNQSGLDALLPARLAGVPWCIHGEHGWDVDNLTGKKWKPALLRRAHSPFVSRYITVSDDLKQYLVARVGIAPTRISQVYNGVDVARFAPRNGQLRRGLPPAFLRDDAVVFGTVGRLQPVKDQATLIRAFAELLRDQPAFTERACLAVVGDGPLSVQLKGLADTLGIASKVWFPGSLNDIPQVLQNFDVFVLPSLSEGISNTILEAMASGLPVVATGVGGNVELVREGEVGYLFAPGDVLGLMRHMVNYLNRPDLLYVHGDAARRAAVDRFSLVGMIRNYQTIYEHFLH